MKGFSRVLKKLHSCNLCDKNFLKSSRQNENFNNMFQILVLGAWKLPGSIFWQRFTKYCEFVFLSSVQIYRFFACLFSHQVVFLLGCLFTGLSFYQVVFLPGCFFTRLFYYQVVLLPGCFFTRLFFYQVVFFPSCFFLDKSKNG